MFLHASGSADPQMTAEYTKEISSGLMRNTADALLVDAVDGFTSFTKQTTLSRKILEKKISVEQASSMLDDIEISAYFLELASILRKMRKYEMFSGLLSYVEGIGSVPREVKTCTLEQLRLRVKYHEGRVQREADEAFDVVDGGFVSNEGDEDIPFAS